MGEAACRSVLQFLHGSHCTASQPEPECNFKLIRRRIGVV